MIKIEHVSKTFNKTNLVIDDINLTLVIGNIILYLLSNKKISKNINKQEL